MDISSSDSVVLTGHKNGDLKLWSSTQQKSMNTVESLHPDRITCARFTPSGKEIVTLGREGSIKITDFGTLKEIKCIDQSNLCLPNGEVQFGLSSNGKFLAVGSADGSVFVFNMTDYSVEEIYQGEHASSVVGCEWDTSARSRLCSIDSAGNLLIWE